LDAIEDAKRQSSDIIVLPEMVIPGYMLGDRWEKDAYVRECVDMNKEVVNATDGITAIWGNISIDKNKR
jgi:NAD+ synthase (glutamine-hydrolysing)